MNTDIVKFLKLNIFGIAIKISSIAIAILVTFLIFDGVVPYDMPVDYNPIVHEYEWIFDEMSYVVWCCGLVVALWLAMIVWMLFCNYMFPLKKLERKEG